MSSETFTEFTIGKYRVVALLGKGGFGTVYRAVDTTLDREVALKVLHPQLAADADFVGRFRNEARAIAALRHPNVVGVYELSEESGRVFIAMEYMPGGTLRDRLAAQGPLSFAEMLTILQQVCAGLEAAHSKGMVHRDIKPANILFNADGQAVVSDFGLVRAVQLSTDDVSSSAGRVGTPFYKAPELWRGKPPVGPATDVYALGCVTYEMLTGKVLFSGETPDEIITKHLVDGPKFGEGWPPGDTPMGVDGLLKKALARTMDERFPSAGAFATALISAGSQTLPREKLLVPQPIRQVSDMRKIPVWAKVSGGSIVMAILCVVLWAISIGANAASRDATLTALAIAAVPTDTPRPTNTLVPMTSSRMPVEVNTPTLLPTHSPTPIVNATVTRKSSATHTVTVMPTSRSIQLTTVASLVPTTSVARRYFFTDVQARNPYPPSGSALNVIWKVEPFVTVNCDGKDEVPYVVIELYDPDNYLIETGLDLEPGFGDPERGSGANFVPAGYGDYSVKNALNNGGPQGTYSFHLSLYDCHGFQDEKWVSIEIR